MVQTALLSSRSHFFRTPRVKQSLPKGVVLFSYLFVGFVFWVILSPVARAEETSPQPPAAEERIVDLSAESLDVWRQPWGEWAIVGEAMMDAAEPRKLAVKPGKGVLYNGPKGRTVNLLSVAEHGDVIAHIEFMVPKGSNSGVYFQGRYEVQVLDSWGVEKPAYSDCGGIYQRWGPQGGYEGHPPRVNASRAPGEWQTFDVIFRAPRFDENGKKIENARFVKVVHNGVIVHENVEVTGPTRSAYFEDEKPTGPLMLQGDHGPVAYRNIRLRLVKLP